jgi:DNA primase
MLSLELKQSLTETAHRYQAALNVETVSYLRERGITKEAAVTFHLGTVDDPAPGHEHAIGCLSIPYRTPSGVVGIKFRRVDGGTPKYIWPTGQKVGMFNVVDLHVGSNVIAICEGELDTLVMSALVGIPAVGVAGVSHWKPHFPKMFEGFDRVVIFADNDIKEDGRNPGMELAKRIKEDLEDAVVIQLPDNKDVNQVYLEDGKEWLYERAMG